MFERCSFERARRIAGSPDLTLKICRRLEAAGVRPEGKCGPHIFRHARAVSLLRASVPRRSLETCWGTDRRKRRSHI